MTEWEQKEMPWQNAADVPDPQVIREGAQPGKTPSVQAPGPGNAAEAPLPPEINSETAAPCTACADTAGKAPAAAENGGQAAPGPEPAAGRQGAQLHGETPPPPQRREGGAIPPSWLEFEYEVTEQDWLNMLQDLNGFRKATRRVYAVMAGLLAVLGVGFLFWGGGRRRVDVTMAIYGITLLCMAGYFVFKGRPANLARLQLRQVKKLNRGVLPTIFNLRLSPRHLLQITPDATSDVSPASYSGLRMEAHTVFILYSQDRRYYWLPGRLFANPEGGPRLEAMQKLLPAWRDAEQARILAQPAAEPPLPPLPVGEAPAFVLRWQQTEQDVAQLARGAQRNAIPGLQKWLGGVLGVILVLCGVAFIRMPGAGSLVCGIAMMIFGVLCLLVPLSTLRQISASNMQNQMSGWQLKRQCSPACLVAGQRWLLFALADSVIRVPYCQVNHIRVDGSLVFLIYDGNLVVTIPCRAFGTLGQAEAFVAFVRQRADADRRPGR